MITLNQTLIMYCWMLFLVFVWGRKNDKRMGVLTALLVTAVLSILFYLPLFWFWMFS